MDFIREMELQAGLEEGELSEGWQLWNFWEQQQRKVKQMVRRNKKTYIQQTIEEIGTPEGLDNIWKAIDKIAPRASRISNALGKEEGGTCLTVEEEKEEVQQFCEKHLQQKRTTIPEGAGDPLDTPTCIFIGDDINEEEWAANKPLKADVREAFRHTHPNKATPEWAIPTKLYVIAENELAEPIRTLWDKIGRESTFPTEWQTQKTVWIPKPGNKKNEVHKRRGITILDGGAKGYLVWLKQKKWETSWTKTTGETSTAQ